VKEFGKIVFKVGFRVGFMTAVCFWNFTMTVGSALTGEGILAAISFVMAMLSGRAAWTTWKHHREGLENLS